MKKITLILLVAVLVTGCTKSSIEKKDAKAQNVESLISACTRIIPMNMLELSAAGQAEIASAVEKCITLVLIQAEK